MVPKVQVMQEVQEVQVVAEWRLDNLAGLGGYIYLMELEV